MVDSGTPGYSKQGTRSAARSRVFAVSCILVAHARSQGPRATATPLNVTPDLRVQVALTQDTLVKAYHLLPGYCGGISIRFEGNGDQWIAPSVHRGDEAIRSHYPKEALRTVCARQQ